MRRVGRWQTPRRAPAGAESRTFVRGNDVARRYEIQRQQWLLGGSHGAAGPCKRICPKTGAVLETIERGDQHEQATDAQGTL